MPIFSCLSLNNSKWGLSTNSAITLRHGDITPTVDGDIAQSSCTIILHVSVGRVEQAHKDGNGASIDKLLPVFIWNMGVHQLH